jgi:hypothetical protein
MSPPEPVPTVAKEALLPPPVAEKYDPKEVVVPFADAVVPPTPTVTAIAVPGINPVMVFKEKPPPAPPFDPPPPHKRTRTELTPAGTVNVPEATNGTTTPLPNIPV